MMKCDPRAFAQCPTHQYCGSCAADAEFMEGSECDKFNQSVLAKPMTNADRIRAMSDEELAYWVMCPHDEPLCGGEPAGGDCMKCCLQWLQQPAEVSDNA